MRGGQWPELLVWKYSRVTLNVSVAQKPLLKAPTLPPWRSIQKHYHVSTSSAMRIPALHDVQTARHKNLPIPLQRSLSFLCLCEDVATVAAACKVDDSDADSCTYG